MASEKTIRLGYYAVLREQRGQNEETLQTDADTPRALYERLRVPEAEGFDFVHGLVECTKRAFRVRDRYVTEVVPGRSFTWESTAPGSRAVGEHEITPTGDGTCDVRLMLDQTGVVGSVVGALYRGLTKRYVQMEADGLTAVATAGDR